MIDGKLSISRKENVKGLHEFELKFDRVQLDSEKKLTQLVIKLTESHSKFQVKLEFTKLGIKQIEKFFLDYFVEQYKLQKEKEKE